MLIKFIFDDASSNCLSEFWPVLAMSHIDRAKHSTTTSIGTQIEIGGKGCGGYEAGGIS